MVQPMTIDYWLHGLFVLIFQLKLSTTTFISKVEKLIYSSPILETTLHLFRFLPTSRVLLTAWCSICPLIGNKIPINKKQFHPPLINDIGLQCLMWLSTWETHSVIANGIYLYHKNHCRTVYLWVVIFMDEWCSTRKWWTHSMLKMT